MSSSDAFWLNFWGVFAAIGFAIVIIGVVIEGVEHFKKFPKKEHARKLHIEKIGWLLVVAGLAMEFLGDHAAKRISDRENARLNKETASAQVQVKRLGLQIIDTSNVVSQANERAAIAGKEAAESNERSRQLQLTNAEILLQVEGLRSDNLLLASNALALAQQIQDTAKTANETRDFVSEPSTTVRLNEAKNVLDAAQKAADDVRSIVTNSNLEALQSKLSQLKPFKERLIDCLDGIDKKIIPFLRIGTTHFEIPGVWVEKYNQLKNLSDEPNADKYITFRPDGNFAIGSDGQTAGEMKTLNFDLNPSLIEEERPRTFSDEQKAYCAIILGKYQGTPFVIESYADPDSTRFGEVLVDLLTTNKWVLAGFANGMSATIQNEKTGNFPRTTEPIGIVIEVNDSKLISAGSALDTFLYRCHVKSKFFFQPKPSSPILGGAGMHIRVGTGQ